MASITREQYDKWNAQARNGFVFDYRYYCIHNEKTIRKMIEMDDGRIIEIRLQYHDGYKRVTNEWGCSYNVPTGEYIPYMDVSVWRPGHTEGVYTSGGWAKSEIVGTPEKTKKYATLCRISDEINTDEIMREVIAA